MSISVVLNDAYPAAALEYSFLPHLLDLENTVEGAFQMKQVRRVFPRIEL